MFPSSAWKSYSPYHSAYLWYQFFQQATLVFFPFQYMSLLNQKHRLLNEKTVQTHFPNFYNLSKLTSDLWTSIFLFHYYFITFSSINSCHIIFIYFTTPHKPTQWTYVKSKVIFLQKSTLKERFWLLILLECFYFIISVIVWVHFQSRRIQILCFLSDIFHILALTLLPTHTFRHRASSWRADPVMDDSVCGYLALAWSSAMAVLYSDSV